MSKKVIQEKVSELVDDIQRILKEEADCSDKEYDKFILNDFSDKLKELFDDFQYSFY